LGRFDDALTSSRREDLVQEATIMAWRWAATARDPERLPAAVRTMARRARCAMLVKERRWRELLKSLTEMGEDGPATLKVVGREVPVEWLLDCLQSELVKLPELDRKLLMGTYEGFCGAELAVRYQCTEASARVRIHRARNRVRKAIELAVVAAGSSDLVSGQHGELETK